MKDKIIISAMARVAYHRSREALACEHGHAAPNETTRQLHFELAAHHATLLDEALAEVRSLQCVEVQSARPRLRSGA